MYIECVFLNSYIKLYTKKVTLQTTKHSFIKLFIKNFKSFNTYFFNYMLQLTQAHVCVNYH